MPKVPPSPTANGVRRHNPLADDYNEQFPSLKDSRPAKRRKSVKSAEQSVDPLADRNTSRKILRISQSLVDDAAKDGYGEPESATEKFLSNLGARSLNDTHQDLSDEEPGLDDDDAWGDEHGDVENEEVDPQDLEVFNRFNPAAFKDPLLTRGLGSDEPAENDQPGTNLAALILEKIAEQESQGNTGPQIMGGGAPEEAVELPVKVVETFTQIGQLLSRYKSGSLPKLVKVLPTLPHWETLISITQPENWTPHATFAATRIFVSARPDQAQHFLNLILLPAIRDSIHETTKLPVQLYDAMKKALYKPAAFFKGLLFPLLASGTATLREAHIVSSVLARIRVPMLHSAAALYRLCDIAAEQMGSRPESAGAANLCIKVLLDKKYALPFKVIDSLVFHFLRFRVAGAGAGVDADAMTGLRGEAADALATVRLPVIWHQCLLSFAQRYKNDITEDQREALLDLLLERGHGAIGPEIRKELLAGRGRGTLLPQASEDGGDDTMVMG